MEFIVSTLLFFIGLGVSVAVVALGVYHIIKGRHRLACLLYCLLSVSYGALAIANLVQQRSGIACAMTPLNQLLIFGGLLLLHLVFLADCMRMLDGTK